MCVCPPDSSESTLCFTIYVLCVLRYMCTYAHVLYCVLFYWYISCCRRQISMLFIDNKDYVFFPHRPSGVHRLTFRRETTYDNLLPPEAVNPGIALQTRSGIHCAKLCREEEWCNSYFYNDVTRLCLRHRAVYLAPPAIDSLSEAGWRYFRHEPGI